MAIDWLKIEANTLEKPEVLAIAAAMGWDDPDLAVAKMIRLWRWFDQYTTDGNAPSVTFSLLDRVIGVTGFCAAVQSVGWLAISEDGIMLPNFDRHCGTTAKTRAETARRVARCKAAKARDLPLKDEGDRGSHGNGDDWNGNAPDAETVTPTKRKGNARSVTKTLAAALPRRSKEVIPPIPPDGGQLAQAVGLKAWLAAVKAAGEVAIAEDDQVFAWAETVGLPDEWLALAWKEFRHRYTQPDAKRYRDWRRVFRKAMRGNWLRLWAIDRSGQYVLTTVGEQARRLHAEAA